MRDAVRIAVLLGLFLGVFRVGVVVPPDYGRAAASAIILLLLIASSLAAIARRASRWFAAVVFGALGLACAAAARDGSDAAARFILFAGVLVLPATAVTLILSPRRHTTPGRLMYAVALLGFGAAELMLPSARPTVDLSAVLLASMVFASPHLRRRVRFVNDETGNKSERYAVGFRLAAAWLFLVWLWASSIDVALVWWTSVPPSEAQSPVVASDQPRRTALSLSGGGYRAALLHAGVLVGLEDLGVPLRAISSVSGGSIIASYYALGGDPHRFRDLVTTGRFNLAREIFNAYNLAPILLSARVPGFESRFAPISIVSRTHVQASLLDRLLLHGEKLGAAVRPGRPALMLCSTDLVNGEFVGIQPGGVMRVGLSSVADRLARRDLGDLTAPRFLPHPQSGLLASDRLALLVAASGAFPGALDAFEPGHPDTVPMALADGGLSDNLGIVLAAASRKVATTASVAELDAWKFEALLISDGSALAMEFRRGSLPNQIQRAVDVIYLSTGARAEADVNGLPTVMLSPRNLIPPGGEPTVGPHDPGVWGVRTMLSWQDGPPPTELRGSPREQLRARLSDPTLQHLISELPSDEAACGRQLFLGLDELKPGVLPPACSSVVMPQTLGPEPETSTGALVLLLSRDLARRLRSFANTSTLDDRIDPRTAGDIFALGRDLVHLKRRALCRLGFGSRSACGE